jgi:hypothetical protein
MHSMRSSVPHTEELVLRARPGSVAVRTAVALVLLAGAGVASERLVWWCVGLAMAVLAWAVHDLRARTRFRVDRGAGRLELPHGKAIALDSIHDISVSGPHQEAPGVCEVMVNQGGDRSGRPSRIPRSRRRGRPSRIERSRWRAPSSRRAGSGDAPSASSVWP